MAYNYLIGVLVSTLGIFFKNHNPNIHHIATILSPEFNINHLIPLQKFEDEANNVLYNVVEQ